MHIEAIVDQVESVIEALKRRGEHHQYVRKIPPLIAKYKKMCQERETFEKMRAQLNLKTGLRKQAGRLSGKHIEGYREAMAMLERFDQQIHALEKMIHSLFALLPNIPDASVPDGSTWQARTLSTDSLNLNPPLKHNASPIPMGDQPVAQLHACLKQYGYVQSSKDTSVNATQPKPFAHEPKAFTYAELPMREWLAHSPLNPHRMAKMHGFDATQHETLMRAVQDVFSLLEPFACALQWLECPITKLPKHARKSYVMIVTETQNQTGVAEIWLDDTGTYLQEVTLQDPSSPRHGRAKPITTILITIKPSKTCRSRTLEVDFRS